MSALIISLLMGCADLWHVVASWGQVGDTVLLDQMAVTQSHCHYGEKWNKQS